jgi:hypothetical protein
LIRKVVWVFVVYERKGCRKVELTFVRWLLPANDPTWVRRSDVEVPVVLDRHADQVRDRVLELLRQLRRVVGPGLGLRAHERRHAGEEEACDQDADRRHAWRHTETPASLAKWTFDPDRARRIP